jgi:Fe2+ or Zn2+ uptake regulation protein
MTSSKLESQRQTILHFWQQGERNAAKIHSLTKIPLQTIYRNLKKIQDTGNVKHKGGSGRIKKITPNAARAIGQYIRRQPTLSAKSVAAKLKDIKVNVSRSTVSRHLAGLGYKNALPLATPILTHAHKQKRVEWAQKHKDDNWKRTLFSDETAFQLFRNTIKHWYKNARPIRPMPKDRSKIFAWGGFCIKGTTSLFCFRQIMTGKFYTEILEKHIPEVRRMLGSRWRLQQDNDPKHTSRIAKEFLGNNVPEVMDWPSNSPDLNPIENLWAIVKRNVELRKPKNLGELEVFLGEEWENIPNSLLINLVNSMPQRCKEVIEKNGERISY